jgi:hypothetical protein
VMLSWHCATYYVILSVLIGCQLAARRVCQYSDTLAHNIYKWYIRDLLGGQVRDVANDMRAALGARALCSRSSCNPSHIARYQCLAFGDFGEQPLLLCGSTEQ